MTVALWIIAICELVRAAQNMMQILMIRRDTAQRDNCYTEFVKSLKDSDSEYVRKMLKEFEALEEARNEAGGSGTDAGETAGRGLQEGHEDEQ